MQGGGGESLLHPPAYAPALVMGARAEPDAFLEGGDRVSLFPGLFEYMINMY